MSYATRKDLVERFGAAEIADLETEPRDAMGDVADPEATAAARIESALADASAEIDAQLAARFVLPLPAGPWPHLVPIACDIARARLYDDEVPEAVVNRARSARRALDGLVADKTVLIDAAGNRAPVRGAALAERAGPEPVMTRDNLAGL